MKKVIFVILCVAAAAVLIINPQSAAPTQSAPLDSDNLVIVTPTPEPTPVRTPVKAHIPEPTPDPTPPSKTRVTVAAVGDLMCLAGQLSAARHGGEYDFYHVFEQIKPIITEADVAMGNLETLVAESFPLTKPNQYEEKTITPSDGSAPYTTRVRISGSPKLNAPESYLSAVIDCGFDVLATANNHSFDRKHEGIVETMEQLEKYGVLHTGSYAAPEDKVPLIVNKNGINIGVVSYTDISNQKPNKTTEAYMLDRYEEEPLAADIAAVREAGAEFVVVYIHWGDENTHKTISSQRKMAQFIADAGADIILGSHSHSTQPFALMGTERGANVPVIYSMGNLVSSMGRTMNKDSVILQFTLEKDYNSGVTQLVDLSYIPTLCRATDAGNFIVLPTHEEYVAESPYASSLLKSRKRTIKVLEDTVATPR